MKMTNRQWRQRNLHMWDRDCRRYRHREGRQSQCYSQIRQEVVSLASIVVEVDDCCRDSLRLSRFRTSLY